MKTKTVKTVVKQSSSLNSPRYMKKCGMVALSLALLASVAIQGAFQSTETPPVVTPLEISPATTTPETLVPTTITVPSNATVAAPQSATLTKPVDLATALTEAELPIASEGTLLSTELTPKNEVVTPQVEPVVTTPTIVTPTPEQAPQSFENALGLSPVTITPSPEAKQQLASPSVEVAAVSPTSSGAPLGSPVAPATPPVVHSSGKKTCTQLCEKVCFDLEQQEETDAEKVQ